MIGGLVLQLIFETEGEVKIPPERTGLESYVMTVGGETVL
jgi:hypothetical protein